MKKKVGDICPHCNNDNLVFMPEQFPYSSEHLSCPECGSTYLINEKDTLVSKELVSIKLGTNFNGYPLENEEGEELVKYLKENQLERFQKNKKYRLVLKIEEIK